ncbi:chaplin [Embleya sp. NBC_00888]|uniref:chaplin n=1 Tax=Embleya sp. NBC_00888 TaxID=2975960 RepID=UPI002F90C92F
MSSFRKITVLMAGTAAVVMAGAGAAHAEAEADGAAVGSPGVASGNNIQVPVHVPVNLCGNTVNIVGVLNPTIGNTCLNIDNVDHDGGHKQSGHHQAPQHGGHQG